MITFADLVAHPHRHCDESEQRCPLLRVCPCCGYRFVSSRSRRQHQNRCRMDLDPVVTAAQHDHLIEVHRIRTRRNGRAWG